jgi:RimJ/RimL family protein N-acetyltransferase
MTGDRKFVLESSRLDLVLESTESVLARIDALSPADRAEVSHDWVERMRSSTPSPWTHGFAIIERASGAPIGGCAYKGPPNAEGVVEIAYGIDAPFRGRGYAKEAAATLVEYANQAGVRLVCAHTRPENGASARVLESCGFECLGEVMDAEDGLVWRWERAGRARAGLESPNV